MALHAAQDVGDAVSVTREFLFPFELSRWLKLAVVVFFIGGGVSAPSTGFDGADTPPAPNGAEIPTTPPADVMTLVAALVALAVLLGIAFAIIGAIMEFVFIESLRNDRVRIRRYWRDRWRQGLRLFGFRIAIGIPMLALFLGWLALFLVPLFTGMSTPEISFAVFLLGMPVLFVVGILFGIVYSFTTVFVVPLMIQQDSGVLAAWRRLWPSIKREWKQYLVYAILALVLTFALGLAASIVVGLAAIVLLVPFALLGVLVYLALSFSTAGMVLLGLLGVVFLAALVVTWALVQVPVVAYLRYYALLVLGDIEADFDVIPDQRAAIRE